MVIHWSLGDSKHPQVSRTFLGILADCNNSLVWRVLILPPISNFWSLFSKPFGIVSSSPVRIVIPMFHCFLAFWQGQSTCLIFRCFFFNTPGDFFKQSLADGLSLSEWQRLSLVFWTCKQFCCLDDLNSYSDFQIFSAPFLIL